MTALVGPTSFPPDHGHRVWEDPSFIKWRKWDAHVPLHCHDTVQGLSFVIGMIYFMGR